MEYKRTDQQRTEGKPQRTRSKDKTKWNRREQIRREQEGNHREHRENREHREHRVRHLNEKIRPKRNGGQ